MNISATKSGADSSFALFAFVTGYRLAADSALFGDHDHVHNDFGMLPFLEGSRLQVVGTKGGKSAQLIKCEKGTDTAETGFLQSVLRTNRIPIVGLAHLCTRSANNLIIFGENSQIEKISKHCNYRRFYYILGTHVGNSANCRREPFPHVRGPWSSAVLH